MLIWLQTASGGWHWPSVLATVGWLFAGVIMAATVFVNWKDRQRAFELEGLNNRSAQAFQGRIRDSEERLTEANARLAEAESRTKEITRLPDGRTRMGQMVSGIPTILEQYFNEMQQAYSEKRLEASYDAAKNAVRVFEETEAMMKDVSMHTGGLTPESAAVLFSRASHLALHFGDVTSQLAWCTRAHAFHRTPARSAELVLALVRAGKVSEAEALISSSLADGGPDAEKLRGYLLEMGVVLPKPNQ